MLHNLSNVKFNQLKFSSYPKFDFFLTRKRKKAVICGWQVGFYHSVVHVAEYAPAPPVQDIKNVMYF